jgi:carbonic anhydrase
MKTYEKLLLENKAWAQEKVTEDPEFFKRLEHLQTPEFLWIGCSDSRVPANEITGTQPGEIFVHRNIANLVVHTDLNLLSVLQYAVDVLKVKHIIVCGHYGCGGVKAAMSNQNFGTINQWLWHIKDVYAMNKQEVNEIADETERTNRLVELSVIEQVKNLAKTSIIQNAWHNEQRPALHGWVYSLADGVIKPVFEIEAASSVDEVYKYDF